MSDQKLHQVLRDMMQARRSSLPSCHLCGEPQNRWYIDLRYTAAGRLLVCIPCANSRRGRGAVERARLASESAGGLDPNRVVFLPSADSVPGEIFDQS